MTHRPILKLSFLPGNTARNRVPGCPISMDIEIYTSTMAPEASQRLSEILSSSQLSMERSMSDDGHAELHLSRFDQQERLAFLWRM
jgi:hypothetical protein